MVRRVHKYADGGKVVKDHLVDDGRPKVGPADPATRRKFLDQRLNETEPLRTKPAATPPASSSGETFGSSPNAYRLLRDRGKQINKAVDKAS